MALSSKFDQNGNNFEMGSHLLMKNGAEIVNLLPVSVPLANTDDWAALAEKAYFIDEVGTGWKLNGVRTYFASTTVVNSMITAAIEAADQTFYFDPSTQSAPVRPDGQPIGSGDIFKVSVAGTWNGQELNPGDTLEAPNAIAGTPVFGDFLYNNAISGLTDVPDGSTSVKGIVQLIGSIRTDGNAVDNRAATEKAVADALATLETAMNAALVAAQALLQNGIDTNAGNITTLNTQMIAVQDVNTAQQLEINQAIADIVTANGLISALQTSVADHDARLVALEEWIDDGVTIPLGGASEVTVDIPTLQFKNLENVNLILLKSDGNGGYVRGVSFSCTPVIEGGVSKVRAKFAAAPAIANYAVRVVGLSKAA